MQEFATQNYLKTIFSLCLSGQGPIKCGDIAKRLNISAAAVTDMVKKLSRDELLHYQPYKGISLTPKGEQIGKKMIRHHRLWETFLYQELGLEWDKVHEEAERLEHASSDYLIQRIEEKLQFPRFDPHGNPIPDRKGRIPKIKHEIPLSDVKLNHPYKIVRFESFDSEFLSYLSEMGVRIAAKIQVLDRLSFDQSLRCQINNTPLNLSAQSSQNIYVIPET